MSAELSGDNWELACSDDEISAAGRVEAGIWAPDPAELEALYSAIEKTGTLALEWRCPGRRAPSPVHSTVETGPDSGGRVTHESHAAEEKSDFDFMDEVSSLRLRMRREGEDTLRGSAKKKTTSFDGVLSNMMRHKRIAEMEKEGSSGSPATSTTTESTPS